MSVFSDAYLDNLKYQQELAQSQTGAGGVPASYEQQLEKARARYADLNQESEAARQFGELVGLPFAHEGIKGLYGKLKDKASKEIGDAASDFIQQGKEYASQKLSSTADRLGVSADDLVNGRLRMKAPDLVDKAKSAMGQAFEDAKSKIAQRAGNAIGVEDPQETLKGMTDLDKAKTALSKKLNVNGEALEKQATRVTRAVKSREQSMADMANRAKRSQQMMRRRANQIADQQERQRISNEAEDRLAKIRDLTSTPKQPAVKLDASDPEYLERSRFQLPSAENDARMKFLEENNPREFEDTTNPFRFKNVMGQDASEALGNYKAQASTFESRAKFLERTQNRAKLAREGGMGESKGVDVADQLKPMRDFMKARDADVKNATKLADIEPNDVRAMEKSRFNQITQKLRDRFGYTKQDQLAQASAPQEQVDEQPPLPDKSQAETTSADEIKNPSYDPHSIASEHGETQMDAQDDPQSLPNTSGQTTQATDTEGETLAQKTAPPPSDAPVSDAPVTGEDVGESLVKGLTTSAETDAELGGPENPIGDVAAAVAGIGSVLASLFSPHPHEVVPPAPRPPPMLNPSTQLGISG